MALAVRLRSLDLTPLRGREARAWFRGIDILSAQDRPHGGAQVGFRRGRGFVREMTGRLIAKFRGSPTLRKVGTFGSASLYAPHGGRSAPRQVA